jgi:hypothetical protein
MVSSPLPALREVVVPRTCGYADRLGVIPGETINFKINSHMRYNVDIVRLGMDVDNTSDVKVFASFENLEPSIQPIHPGSYVRFEGPPAAMGQEFSLEVWLRPWTFSSPRETDVWSAIIANFDYPDRCGFALLLDKTGMLLFYAGDGGEFQELYLLRGKEPVERGKWHHVVAAFDHGRMTLWLDGLIYADQTTTHKKEFRPAQTRLQIGSAERGGVADYFLDADAAYPAIEAIALSHATVYTRYARVTSHLGVAPLQKSIPMLAYWELKEESGETVSDSSGSGLDGRIINHATWRIGGPSVEHDLTSDPDYDPSSDVLLGHGIRFCSDDLVDCAWKNSVSFKIPEYAESGYYAARITSEKASSEITYHITFVVRPKSRKSGIAMIASTNTWYAYDPEPYEGSVEAYGLGMSFYNRHKNGAPTYFVGLRRPNPSADPYEIMWKNDLRYSHLVRGERFVQSWLESSGYPYDLFTDYDLHHDADLLRGYKVVVVCAHSEYWSTKMQENLDNFLRNGGSLVCLSGNTMFWRVSIEDETIECRKFMGFASDSNVVDLRRAGAEIIHSQDGRRGGLLRSLGLGAYRLLGVDTYGVIHSDSSFAENWQPFRVVKPDHFLFRGLNVKLNDEIAKVSGNGLTGCGDEFDISIGSFRRAGSRSKLPAPPRGLEVLARVEFPSGWPKMSAVIDFDGSDPVIQPLQGGEIIYWERPEGGRVLTAGAISVGGSLGKDRIFSGLVTNALAHFGVSRTSSAEALV